jgi:hypothetical protein
VGGGDKVFRIVLGLVLITLPFLMEIPDTWKIIMWVVAAIALITAFVGFCPLNKLIGLNTCKPKIG